VDTEDTDTGDILSKKGTDLLFLRLSTELVRYVHLNPLRAGLMKGLNELDNYSHSGHSTLMGSLKKPWQETEEILRLFGKSLVSARQLYAPYLKT